MQDWTPTTLFFGLRTRFISQIRVQQAATIFDKMKQDDRDVEVYFNDLSKVSRRLVQTPTDYGFRRRFFNGLNTAITNAMTRMGYTAESDDMDELLKGAKWQEAAIKTTKASTTSRIKPLIL